MKIVFILANSADPDEIPPYASFHQSLYCLPNLLLVACCQNENKLISEVKGSGGYQGSSEV